MPDKLRSRKFWIAVIAALLPIVAQALTSEIGVDQAIQASVAVVVAYLFGQAYVDGKAAESVESDEG